MSRISTTFSGTLLGLIMLLCGCGTAATEPDDASNSPTVVSEIKVTGFDPDGEPVIQNLSDGSLRIQFEAMPPFFAEDAGIEDQFNDFRADIEEAAGVAVTQDDREVFIVASPEGDTAEKIKTWLETYPKPN